MLMKHVLLLTVAMVAGIWAWAAEKQEFTVNEVSFKMVFVEGGTFTMGATAEQGTDAGSNESPTHEVTLSSFGIGETLVTQKLWLAAICGNPSTASPTWVCVWLCPIWMTRRLRT